MNDFIISSDETCDLPITYCKENRIPILPVYYYMENTLYGKDKIQSLSAFYKKMRNNVHPTTVAPNIEDTKNFFNDLIKSSPDIIHIAFSGALSSTCQNALIAANEIMDCEPDVRIKVIDSLCSSLGEGLLIYKAQEYAKNHTFEEVTEYIEETKRKIAHIFTVDDLSYLQQGGRISRGTKIIGNLINIKPILHVNGEGELKMIDKVRGRKKAISYLFDKFITESNENNSTIMISHCDCIDDVNTLKKMILDKTTVKKIIVNQISPCIGAHSGPGTLAIFYEK